MIVVRSTFADTVDALAQSNGPYVVDAGAPLTFTGGPAAPDTDYFWDFGDGATATGATAIHTYADDGVYVAKLRTVVNQPGGVETRHFAQVVARNVPPVIEPLPSRDVDEGAEFELVASFTDQEWPDTHTAVFDFGDDSLPVAATVSEKNAAPQAKGKARAKHAYCDDGTYTVTVKVMDDDGGVATATTEVRVANVSPSVDAGSDLFAYRCTPLTLVGRFTDPGWCDTHVGTWDFGDCTPTHPAVIYEENDPPDATGIVVATHVYSTCGSFLAVCEVVDDDGGSGADTTVVRVVDVVNGDFEGGFRRRAEGTAANGWTPYAEHAPARAEGTFSGEEIVVHSGQRSQRIDVDGPGTAGIHQNVGANPGWDYQVSAWYHVDPRAGGRCRLGLDPEGRADPTAAGMVWSEGTDAGEWRQLVVRGAAAGGSISIFLDARGSEKEGATAFFDDVALTPFPCPVTFEEPPEEAEEQALCVDWRAEREEADVGPLHYRSGFVFRSLDRRPLRVVTWGPPRDEGKLAFGERGVDVVLPWPSAVARVTVALNAGRAIEVVAFDATDTVVDRASADPKAGDLQTLELFGPGMTHLTIKGGGNEGTIVEICVRAASGEKKRSINKARPSLRKPLLHYSGGQRRRRTDG